MAQAVDLFQLPFSFCCKLLISFSGELRVDWKKKLKSNHSIAHLYTIQCSVQAVLNSSFIFCCLLSSSGNNEKTQKVSFCLASALVNSPSATITVRIRVLCHQFFNFIFSARSVLVKIHFGVSRSRLFSYYNNFSSNVINCCHSSYNRPHNSLHLLHRSMFI